MNVWRESDYRKSSVPFIQMTVLGEDGVEVSRGSWMTLTF